jgi:predicted nucleic acid-binding Zn ribbon protein
MSACVVCGKPLTGRQRKFCSKSCNMRVYQSYDKQKTRGIERKLMLVEMFGGECHVCGYKKNLAALSFHHVNAEHKEIGLDVRHLSNRTWSAVLEEVSKCVLLCANCHMEQHYPNLAMDLLKEKA